MTSAKKQILNQIKAIQDKAINQKYENQIWQIVNEKQINDIYQLVAFFENNIDDVALFRHFYQHYEVQLFARPSVTIDLIYLRYNQKLGKIQVLLKKRQHEPFKNALSLYGSFLAQNRSINDAVLTQCQRDLNFEINDNSIIRLPAVSKPGRDPRMWVITNPNIVLFNAKESKNINGLWVTLGQNFKINKQLAFDHQMILETAFDYLKTELEHKQLLHLTKLLGREFTLPNLRNLLTQFKPELKKQATANIFDLYKNQLIKTGKSTKDYIGFKGGRPSALYKIKND